MDFTATARSLAADLAAAAGTGAVVAWSVSSALGASALIAACAAGITFLRIFPSLRRLRSGRQYRVAPFQPAALEFASAASGDQSLQALDPIARAFHAEPVPDSAPAAIPTVRELQESIQRRLGVSCAGEGEGQVDPLNPAALGAGAPDASEKLRDALRELRRAIG